MNTPIFFSISKKHTFFIILTINCLLIGLIYIVSNHRYIISRSEIIQHHANAFIITYDCKSNRFNQTKANIERVFPNFFHIYCFPSIPLNDSRVHTSSSSVEKKYSSNLLSFINVWTYEIPKYSQYNHNDDEWSFVFEDDVNFTDPAKFSLINYIEPLQKLMINSEIRFQDGLMYLGICGPTFSSDSQQIEYSNNSLLSTRGSGWCAHAMGITIKRAKHFWIDISSYRPTPEGPIDTLIVHYCHRSQKQFYVLGSNLHWPPGTGHYGIAFQDRGQFPSQIN